jgi:hypothetical protein
MSTTLKFLPTEAAVIEGHTRPTTDDSPLLDQITQVRAEIAMSEIAIVLERES